MGDMERTARPLGWWLKEADARIDAAFDRALGRLGLDRRGWQILATLARQASTQRDVAAALSRFADDVDIVTAVADLVDRGMVRRGADDVLELTDRGARTQEQAGRQVDVVRGRVGAALGDDGYTQLINLLRQLVEALPDDAWRNGR